MNKLWIDYSPEKARYTLERKFCAHPEFLQYLRKLSRSNLSILAALCDGKSVTTLGNLVEADYGITRASAVIQFLRKQFSIPITRELKVISTDCGMKARQAIYKIEACNLVLLKNNLNMYSDADNPHSVSLAKMQAKKKIQRLIDQFGHEWVIKTLEDISHGTVAPAGDMKFS